MSDPAAMPRVGLLKWALWGAALIGVASVVYIMAQASFKPAPAAGDLKSLARGEMAKLTTPDTPPAPPTISFFDPAGKTVGIGDFKGRIVVLNMWATWCAPCVAEMPTLARLQAAYPGKVEVVAVSVDTESAESKARAFIGKHSPLKFYSDPEMKLPFDVKPAAPGMPTTILYGRDGIERARLSGDADWSGQDARAVVEALLAEKG